MAKRVSALSQVLKETQAAANQPPITALPQDDNTAMLQSDNTALPQSDNTVKPQYRNTAKQQRARRTDERDKVTYYLNPGQLDKLDELRTTYRKATGQRLNEQEFIRLIIDRLELHHLL
jgi:hypothetical protein